MPRNSSITLVGHQDSESLYYKFKQSINSATWKTHYPSLYPSFINHLSDSFSLQHFHQTNANSYNQSTKSSSLLTVTNKICRYYRLFLYQCGYNLQNIHVNSTTVSSNMFKSIYFPPFHHTTASLQQNKSSSS